MKRCRVLLLIILLSSCSNDADFYSAKSFKSLFTQGLFLSKLAANNIPYQLESYMGEHYVLVHVSFKEKVMKLRNDSQQESRALALINLENECSQQQLAQQFKAANVHHITLNKGGLPSIRLTQKDRVSNRVNNILANADWRCD